MRRLPRRVAALVGEGIKLFDMSQIDAHLLAYPMAQADFHGAMLVGHEGAKWQAFGLRRAGLADEAALQALVMLAQNSGRKIDENFTGVCAHGASLRPRFDFPKRQIIRRGEQSHCQPNSQRQNCKSRPSRRL